MSNSIARVDLYTTIHKGIRTKLFEATSAAARVDPDDAEAVDALHATIEQLLGFLEDHADHEDRHVLPALRTVAPALEASLAADHRGLHELETDVALGAEALSAAARPDRHRLAAELARTLNRLTAGHLTHMHREETEANVALWAGLDDGELIAIQTRIVTSVEPARMTEWMTFVLPSVSPTERAHLTAAPT